MPSEVPMSVSQQQMQEAHIPLHARDSCAHLLIPLNECRREGMFLPWKCEHERHVYIKCQYEEYKTRVAAMTKLKEEQLLQS
mmetsp:Transcript_16700/g.23028  ORF Transcript_16700/g.23028 Transcript_16700/m.23028 type:complete len:82 (-) Transcript_16700:1939-2184(-)